MKDLAAPPEALLRDIETGFGASNLRQACRSLLDRCTLHFGLERAAIVTRLGDHVEGVAVGFPEAVLDDIRSRTDAMPPGERDPCSGGPHPYSRHGQLDDLTCLPLHVAALEFSGSLWVEASLDGTSTDALRTLLARAAPALAQLAELDGLRDELRRYRDKATQLRRTVDRLPDPVIIMGEAGEVRLSTRRADELLMARPEDRFGRRRAVETNNLFFSAFRARALLGDESGHELFLVDPRDGSDLLFEVEVHDGPALGDHDAGSMFILRDITDLQRATTELEAEYKRSVAAQHRSRRESERLNVILANAGVPILVTDERSDIVLMNHEAERLFQPSVVHGSESSFDIQSNDATITGLISDFLLHGEPRREVEARLHDPARSSMIPVRVVLTKIVSRRAEPTAVVCVVHDLSEKREAERLAIELQRLNADLEARVEAATVELSERNRDLELKRQALVEASRMKTEFLAMMSHELRTPISSILGFNTLLQDEILGPLTSGQRDTLKKMRNASDHLLSLINDVLDLSQVEAGKLSVRPKDFSISPFVEDLAETIRPMARTKGLEFVLELQDDLPVVRADPVRLRQVVLNLASNAVKFTEAGRITLRTGLADGGRMVRVEVEDTGIGIQPEHLEEIFEEFRQVDRMVMLGHGGTGLGLSISRKLVHLMDGLLRVRSERGAGSTFWIELPTSGESRRSPGASETAPTTAT